MQTNSVFSRTETTGPILSNGIYILAIGLTLCWGFLANFLIVRTVPVESLRAIHPLLFILGFFACAMGGVFLFNKSDKPAISFLGYNLVVLPFGLVITLVISQYADPKYDGLVLEAIQTTGFVTFAMMMLGWGFGRMLTAYQAHPDSAWHPEKVLLVAGGIGLSVFAVLRGLNSYGNMWLLREDHSLVQWLHVSKYPPSITFTALELGLMALCLYVFFRYQRTLTGAPRAWNPLMVFGQTALFFYIFHMHILGLVGFLTGTIGQLGLPGTYLFTLGILALMYPLCVRFRRYKAANPHKWVRYI